jgi:hypothetical protein
MLEFTRVEGRATFLYHAQAFDFMRRMENMGATASYPSPYGNHHIVTFDANGVDVHRIELGYKYATYGVLSG